MKCHTNIVAWAISLSFFPRKMLQTSRRLPSNQPPPKQVELISTWISLRTLENPPTPACKGERALRRVFGTTRTTTTTSTLTSTTRTRTKTRRRTRTRTTTRTTTTTTTTTPAAAATTTTTRPKWGDVWYTERPVHVFPF